MNYQYINCTGKLLLLLRHQQRALDETLTPMQTKWIQNQHGTMICIHLCLTQQERTSGVISWINTFYQSEQVSRNKMVFIQPTIIYVMLILSVKATILDILVFQFFITAKYQQSKSFSFLYYVILSGQFKKLNSLRKK